MLMMFLLVKGFLFVPALMKKAFWIFYELWNEKMLKKLCSAENFDNLLKLLA
jgi:hypothetical protein